MILTVQAKNLDPTQTTTIRKRYRQAVNARFAELKRLLNLSIEDFVIMSSIEPEAFAEWFRRESYRIILYDGELPDPTITEDTIPGDGLIFAAPILGLALLAGFRHADRHLKKKGFSPPRFDLGLLEIPNKTKFFARQSFALMKSAIDDMVTAVKRVVTNAWLVRGGVADTLDSIRDRIDKVGRYRGRMISVTEVVKAHADATLDRFEQYGIGFVTALVEFATAQDDRVCQECMILSDQDNGYGAGVFTIEQARGIIPVHTRCRCGWIPA